jgi:peptidoglycan DL-endopeptidase CwlO
VLGQAHTPRRRLWLLVAGALVVLAIPAVGGAIPSHSASSLRAHDASIAAKSRSAVLGLYALDERLAAARTRLGSLRDRAETLRAERAALRLELRIAKRSSVRAERQLARRLRDLYEQGDVGPLEILFGATSLDEAMANLDSLSRVSTQNRQIVAQLKGARNRLSAESHALAHREAALAVATREAAATATSLEHARAQRTSYIASLAAERRLTQHAIAAVVARAHAAQARSEEIARTTPRDPSDAPPAPAGSRTLTVSATGYSLGGSTSTGLPVGWGIAAVDPSLIPLGTHMTVLGYGEAVAADTGGAVTGAMIDLWFPTVAQANEWGRRTVTVILH